MADQGGGFRTLEGTTRVEKGSAASSQQQVRPRSRFDDDGTNRYTPQQSYRPGEKRKSSESTGAAYRGSEPERKKLDASASCEEPSTSPSLVTIGLNKAKKAPNPIKMQLGQKPKEPVKKKMTVANAFNQDDSDDEEEMPAEARMRMRNMGRMTPTAAGPNSYGKGSLGFCDRRKMLEREMKEQLEEVSKTVE